jgi:hypothetical protein
VYVNINPERKHITLHVENSKPCPDVFKHTKKDGRDKDKFYIEDIEGLGTFKTAEKPNSYWLIVHGADLQAVFNNTQVKNAEKELGVCICVCSKCK